MKYVRNFSIIAHIDHGKSTLADRLIQLCTDIQNRDMSDRLLDSMDLEKERGITIKSQTVRLTHKYKGETYTLNLIDTPGHIDFSYEVVRSMRACEGSLLLVDATRGIQAQTIKNALLAIDNGHEIITVINKIDVDSADIEGTINQVDKFIGVGKTVNISAKNGTGIEALLDAIVEEIPHPKGDIESKFRAFIVDSWYDKYLGIVGIVRAVDGVLKPNTDIISYFNKNKLHVYELGYFSPHKKPSQTLVAGDIGYIVTRDKSITSFLIGDSLFLEEDFINGYSNPIFEEFKVAKQSVFCGVIPIGDTVFNTLLHAVEKINLNDPSFCFSKTSYGTLGTGLRVGFLGILHMEVIIERIKREFDLEILVMSPSVSYLIHMQNDDELTIDDPSIWPDLSAIKAIHEPFADTNVITPIEYVGDIMELCKSKRGIQKDMVYIDSHNVSLDYLLPLAEIITNFHDKLQSTTKGYGSFSYDNITHHISKIVKLEIKVNFEIIEAFSVLIHRDSAESIGRSVCETLAANIPRQQFNIPVQAVVGGTVVARDNIKPYRKDVTGKCYGGDITRKMKLLNKQKKGKKNMARIGKINIPNSIVIDIVKKL